MKLDEGGGPKEDPREKLRRLREEMAVKAAATKAAAQATNRQ
jgi:ATP-dependent DNA helicase Rep